MSRHSKLRTILVLAVVALFSMGADFDPNETFKLIMTWRKPDPYPPPMLQGMDIPTLSTLLDSGNLQWYEPRPLKDRWEGVVGVKIHAPYKAVWDVLKDYEIQCKIMADTFDFCQTIEREGNQVKNRYKIHTSVVMYSYKIDMLDIVKEDPPYHMHINTVEGGLKGRELDIILVPIENDTQTLMFMRYFANLRSLGREMQVVLAIMPLSEPPIAVNAANYHSRAVRNEAERRVGYKAPKRPKPLLMENLDIKTLRKIDEGNGGLIRETPQGDLIDALTYTFIDAPPELVWEVVTDFEHYEDIFKGSECEIESIDGNTVLLRQETAAFKILVFRFGQDLHSRYVLDPPHHVSFTSIDGTYEGTHGDLRIVPLENGTKTLLFAIAGINLTNDNSLASRVAKSGAFPMDNMINMLSAQATLAYIRVEAERRGGK